MHEGETAKTGKTSNLKAGEGISGFELHNQEKRGTGAKG